MAQTIAVTFISPGVFTWADTDNGNTVATGTGTTVQNAGSQALAAMKTYLTSQAAAATALGTNWQ